MKVYSILEFGAKPNGELCTEAIQATIDACAIKGGIVEIPPGTYITGNLRLRSNIEVHICKGAILKGSTDIADYEGCEHIHNEFGKVLSLMYATNCINISFTGEGVIDFNGDVFFDYSKPHSDKVDLLRYNEVQLSQFPVKSVSRPNQLIFLKNCKNIRLEGLTFLNAPCWGIVFSSCDIVKVMGITIRFSLRIPNSDGIHLCSCKNVIISNCDIVSGDDCIAITGIDDWEGVSSNIVISNCLLSSTSAAIRIGYWESIVKNVQISNCVMYECTRGICMMSCGSGLISDVSISNIKISTKSRVGGWWGIGEPIYILGLSHMPNNVYEIELKKDANQINIKNITFRDIAIEAESIIVVIGDSNIDNIKIYNMQMQMLINPNKEVFLNYLDLQPSTEQRKLPTNQFYWGYFEGIKKNKLQDIEVLDCNLKEYSERDVYIKNL